MTRMVSAQPFDFRSDFSAPDPGQAGHVSMSAEELTALLSRARMEGRTEAKGEIASDEAMRMDAAGRKLNDALADLVKLAEHLERCSYDPDMADGAARLINAAASRIIDGQGDLFT